MAIMVPPLFSSLPLRAGADAGSGAVSLASIDLCAMPVGEAAILVMQTRDEAALQRWLADEGRRVVRDVITAQLDKLAAPTPPPAGGWTGKQLRAAFEATMEGPRRG